MSISSVMAAGLQGIQAGINRTAMVSGRITAGFASADGGDMAGNMVGLLQGSNDVKIAANVVKTGDELLGTLIDMHA